MVSNSLNPIQTLKSGNKFSKLEYSAFPCQRFLTMRGKEKARKIVECRLLPDTIKKHNLKFFKRNLLTLKSEFSILDHEYEFSKLLTNTNTSPKGNPVKSLNISKMYNFYLQEEQLIDLHCNVCLPMYVYYSQLKH